MLVDFSMNTDAQQLLSDLMLQERVAALAVIVTNKPVTGLLPFVAAPDLQAVYILASTLARHSAGLYNGAPFSILIHDTRRPHPDSLQIPRLSLEGEVRVLATDDLDNEAVRQLYLAKFPSSEGLFALTDFNLYRLVLTGGRFIAGFAQAYNLSPGVLRSIALSRAT